ncbi:MAG: hypothetical protein CL862_13865 [Cyanobium sp. NAT70]|nr:hypothetical protein [Cyanobium sp. NAT70]|tara:strand:+ start:1268 stop:1732 length:465 start_codon:yes stop_codon:yes gene_type:complete
MPLLALSPPPPPTLLCTINTVQSEWSPQPIASVRILKGMQFNIHPGPPFKVDPTYVIDSRLTLIAREQEPAKFIQIGKDWVYRWSFQASLGPVASEPLHLVPTRDARAEVKGELTLITPNRFRLSNITMVVPVEGGAPLTRLNEKATGDCHEQH